MWKAVWFLLGLPLVLAPLAAAVYLHLQGQKLLPRVSLGTGSGRMTQMLCSFTNTRTRCVEKMVPFCEDALSPPMRSR